MRIAIHTQYYPPEVGAPQARLSDLAQKLRERGHEVFVLTGMPSYPTGRIFKGYGGLFRREELDGVTVLRSALYPTQSPKMVRRLFNYFSFVLSSLIVGLFRLPRLEYILTESPPLFLGLTGYVLSRVKRARWIFNVSDLWPETVVRQGTVRDGLALSLAWRLESFCYRKAWLVSTQTRGMQADIADRFPGVRTYHLSNGVDLSLFSPDRRSAEMRQRLKGQPQEENGSCVAIYAGLHGLLQGLDQVLAAARELGDQPNLSFVFVGDGPEKGKLVRQSHEQNLGNVRFLDVTPRSQMPSLLASADIAVVPLKFALPGAAPSKLYEAMGAALPIVLIADGEAAEIVQEANAGIVVSYGDITSLATALKVLTNDPERRRRLGEAGRRAALEKFDRRAITTAFAEYLESSVAESASR
jgi:glycosyltransferase involved in cell wall biosynthesis